MWAGCYAVHRRCVGVNQRGTSMVEFLIVLPMLLFTGTGIMQFGLIYHAKSILNYATFEAARVGAVSHAQIEPMRAELGYRLAPVYGGDGGAAKGVMSQLRAAVAVNDISTTKIEILNPTRATFEEHATVKDITDSKGNVYESVRAIPNAHLRFAPTEIKDDGLHLRDANLLKVKVTYGYQMRMPFLDVKVPGVPWIMRNVFIRTDPKNWQYYARGMMPLTASATVRMQSDAMQQQEPPKVVQAFNAAYQWMIESTDNETATTNDENAEACTPAELPNKYGLYKRQGEIERIDSIESDAICAWLPADNATPNNAVTAAASC